MFRIVLMAATAVALVGCARFRIRDGGSVQGRRCQVQGIQRQPGQRCLRAMPACY
jgi:hypothetical protein